MAYKFNPFTGTLDVIESTDISGKVDRAGDTMTGTLVTQNIEVDGDKTRDIGTTTDSFRRVHAQIGQFLGDSGTVTLPTNVTHGGLLVGTQTGAGTNINKLNGGSYPAIACMANTYSVSGATAQALGEVGATTVIGSAFASGSGAVATLKGSGFGSICTGYAYAQAGTSTIQSTGSGSFTAGYVNSISSTSSATMTASGAGAFTHAFIRTGTGTSNASIQSAQQGSFSQGYIVGTNNQSASISSQGKGSFIQGSCRAGGVAGSATGTMFASSTGSFIQGSCRTGTMSNSGEGGFIQGYTSSEGTISVTKPGAFAQGVAAGSSGDITASGKGAFAQGNCNNGTISAVGNGSLSRGWVINGVITATNFSSMACGFASFGNLTSSGYSSTIFGGAYLADIIASGDGAFASGYARNGNNITASATGSFAQGDSNNGAITAGAQNAVQLGPGINNLADSLQIGNDFLAKANGQHAGKNDTFTLGAAATTFVTTSNVMTITGDSGGNTIATITGGIDGQLLTLIFVDANVTITDNNAHAIDSVDLSAAFTSADDTTLQLVYDGTSWYETSRSVN